MTAVASLTRVRVVVDYTLPSAHPTAKINKVKDFVLIFDHCL